MITQRDSRYTTLVRPDNRWKLHFLDALLFQRVVELGFELAGIYGR